MKNFRKILFSLIIVTVTLAAFSSCGKCKHPSTELTGEKAATCSADGYTGDKVCSDCGEVVESGSKIPALGHNYEETITKTPSCLVDGSKKLTCKTCGDEKTETIQAPGTHSYDSGTVTIEPTCVDGRFTYSCTACGAKKHEAIPANKPHDYDDGVVTDPATCLQTGVLTKTCKACKEATKTEAIPVVAHKDVYHDELDGTHAHTCLVCTYNKNEAHTPKDAGVPYEASCLEPAYVLHTCVGCNSTYKIYDEGSEPLGHSYGKWAVVDATCSTVGHKTHVCSICEATESIEIPKNPTAHTFGTDGVIKKEASCSEEGIRLLSCAECSATKEVAIPVSAHSFSDGEGDGSGWVTQSCGGCNATRTYFDASTLKEAELTVESIPEGEDLELGMENATISIPKDVIDQIKGNEGESVSVKADFVGETEKNTLLSSDKLTEEQKSRLEGEEIYDFGISGVASFTAAVTVTVPYSLKDGEDPDGIVIWYVEGDGNVQEVPATYNATTETVTFSVEHFSFYAVAYEETQAMKCRRGVHDFVKTDTTVQATCFNYGYTVYECSHCHAIDFGDFVNMLEHDWGDITEPTVTCDQGGYAYRECSKCSAHLESYYVRAKGHTPTADPSCTAAAVCSTCGGVVKPALGHKWSAWETTKQPTATTEGEKARECYTCKTKETVKIAMTGKVDPVNFETVEDMYKFILKEFTGLSSGKFSIDLTLQDGTEVKADFAFTTSPFKLSLIATVPAMMSEVAPFGEGEEPSPYAVGFYYDGKMAYVLADGEVMITDLQSMINATGVSVEFIMDVFEATFSELNTAVEQLVVMAEDIIAVLPGTLSVTVSEYVDAIKTVYTYYALLLGFDTNLEMVTGVKVPSHQDFAILLEALMTSEEKDGVITYTLTAKNLTDAIENALAFIEDNADKTYGDILFTVFEEDIKRIYPNAESFTDLISTLSTEFHGALTVRDALIKLLYIATTQNITADDIYTVIDTFMKYAGAEDFDSKTMLEEYFDLTLNELLEMAASSQGGADGPNSGSPDIGYDSDKNEGYIDGGFDYIDKPVNKVPTVMSSETQPEMPTMEMLFEMISSMLTGTTLGETVISEEDGMTVEDLTASVRAMLDEMDIELDVVIKTDAYGNLISADASFDFGSTDPETGDKHSMVAGSVNITSQTTVEAPELFEDYLEINVTTKTESNGDITVNGIPEGAEVEIDLNGELEAELKKLLVPDATLTAKYGLPVYRLDPEYSHSSSYISSLIYINGKYYEETNYRYATPGEIIEKINVSDFLANPEGYLPDEDFEPVGYIQQGGYKYESSEMQKIPVYLTVAGFVYEQDGVWQIINVYMSNFNLSHNGDKHDYSYEFVFYGNVVSAPYSEFFANVSIDSVLGTADYYDYKYDGFRSYYGPELYESLVLITMANTAEYASWGTTPFTFGKIEENELYFVRGSQGFSIDYATAGEVSAPPAHSYYHSYETEIWNGNKLVKAICYNYYVSLPEYFVQIKDGVYANLGDSGVGFAVVSSFSQTLNLPDGNLLYVKGNDGPYVFGYVKLAEDFFVQAVYDQSTGEIVYRNATSVTYVNPEKLFSNDAIVKNSDGTYTVSAEIIEFLDRLSDGNESGYILVLNILTGDAEIMLPIRWQTPELPDVGEIMGSVGGGFNGEEEIHWDAWFGDSYGANAVPNGDGTVSIFFANGDSISYSFGNYENFPLDDVVSRDDDYSEEMGFPVYGLTQKYKYEISYVKIGNKLYRYNTEDAHKAEFFSSASNIKASKFYIDELTYFIPSGNPDDDTTFDVYLGTVYIEGLSSPVERYFAIIDGKLMVLTGAELISDSAITYEGMMEASDYFAALRISVNTLDYYWYEETYLNGTRCAVYSVRATVTEPMSVSGLEDDLVISDNRVLAIKNGGFYKYIKSYEYIDNVHYLVLSDEATPESGETFRYEYEESFTNGTFTIVNYEYVSEAHQNVIKIAGRFYNFYTSAWIYSEENFKESFYEKVYLFKGVKADGTVDILIGEDGGYGLVIYDGNLSIENADKTQPLYGYETSEYDSLTQYVFYLYDGSADDPVSTVTICGNEIYVRKNGNRAFAKLAENRYVAGRLVEYESKTEYTVNIDGRYYGFHPEDYYEASISSESIKESPALNNIITVKANGRVLVVSEEIFDFFGGSDFELWVTSENYMSRWFSKDELLAIFDKGTNPELTPKK